MATDSPTIYTPSCFDKVWGFYAHPDNKPLVASYRTLVCNTCILAERVFSSFPPLLAYLSRTTCSYSGVLALYEYNLPGEVWKSATDCYRFATHQKKLGMLLTALKVYFKSIDILLIVGGATVALAALAGFPQWISLFYLFMRPYTLSSLTLSAISLIADYTINKKLLSETMPDRKLWVQAQREPGETETSLQSKVQISRDQAIKMAVNQALLMISAAYPGTILSASLIWSSSLVGVYLAHRKKQLKANSP